jgi:ABC-2 type transport system permease protein
MNRLFVLVKRECIDVSRNYLIWSTMLVPSFLSLMYKLTGSEHKMLMWFPLLMSYVFIGMVAQPILIAEEKEKQSFTVYRVSPFHYGHLIVAKSIVSILFSLFVTILIVAIDQFSVDNILLFACTVLLTTLFFIFIGTLTAFYSKNAMDTSVKGIPLLFFPIFPVIADLSGESNMLMTMNELLPGQAIINGLFVSFGGEVEGVWQDMLLLTGWTVIAFVLCLVIYKKRKSL